MKLIKTNDIASTLSAVLILVLVVVGVGSLYNSTDGFTSSQKAFYLEQGNNRFNGDYTNYKIEFGKEYQFDVTSYGGLLDNEQYTVDVYPNTNAEDFQFGVHGQYYDDNGYLITGATVTQPTWHKVGAITGCIGVVTNRKGFTLTVTKDLEGILEEYYNADVVGYTPAGSGTTTPIPTAIDSNIDYFVLSVASVGTNKTVINITFSLVEATDTPTEDTPPNTDEPTIPPTTDDDVGTVPDLPPIRDDDIYEVEK